MGPADSGRSYRRGTPLGERCDCAAGRRKRHGAKSGSNVSGREVAELGPMRRHRWRQGADVREIFRGPADLDWQADRDTVDQSATDPFTR